MNYSPRHIAEIIGAKMLNKKIVDYNIQHVVFDSRKADFPIDSIFFAFKSSRNNGHTFIKDLYKKGVRNFLVSEKISRNKFPKSNFFFVENTLAALQALAIHHRKKFDIPIIGITGSNGKTIVKEWLFQLLKDDYSIVRSPRSFNSQLGVPLSVLPLKKEHSLGIFEAGISTTQEMKKLQPIIDCSIGVFTNIGQAHSEGFKNNSQKIKEKIKLFKNTKTIIFCKDHHSINKALSALKNKALFSWSRSQTSDLQILKEEKVAKYIHRITARFKKKKIQIDIPFFDAASVENAIHCWLVLLVLDLDQQKIRSRMSGLSNLDMRLELKSGINDSTLINDSYNSDLTSLATALNFMEQQSGTLSKTVILSDILQSGKTAKTLYQEVAQLLHEKKISKCIGIGKSIQKLDHLFKGDEKYFYKTTEAFLAKYHPEDFQKEIILLKGARHFEFEKIANHLTRKSHNTRLEVNLNALTNNLNVFKKRLKGKTKLMVMIKAAAYGSGSDEVARLLQYQKVDYFAVAYADEGVELRKAGINVPIMVLNPETATFDLMLRYDLEPEIYSIHLLQQFLKHLSPKQASLIHIKLDTGMHRLGFEEKDLDQLISILHQNPTIKLGSIFSHLAASDESKHDTFSHQQLSLFKKMYRYISKKIGYRPQRHILNSSGIIRFPQYHFDMVRLGIGMYGIDGSNMLEKELETVLTLKASISQIKSVKKDETIGYGRKGSSRKDIQIATVSIGYADGLLRKAGNGRYSVLIHGKKAPIIGNVCMDMTMVDISKIPEAKEGDEVIIFGKDHPVESLAKCYNSLTYEVFTGISERVKRVYFQD